MIIIDINEIKELNKLKGQHWFENSTVKFFNCRVSSKAYLNKSKTKAYFISSEKQDSLQRRYTIRVHNMETGNINTVGDFQRFETSREAKIELDKYLRGEVKE